MFRESLFALGVAAVLAVPLPAFAKRPAEKPEPVDVQELLRHADELWQQPGN